MLCDLEEQQRLSDPAIRSLSVLSTPVRRILSPTPPYCLRTAYTACVPQNSKQIYACGRQWLKYKFGGPGALKKNWGPTVS